jgi:hypothetical protein
MPGLGKLRLEQAGGKCLARIVRRLASSALRAPSPKREGKWGFANLLEAVFAKWIIIVFWPWRSASRIFDVSLVGTRDNTMEK